MSSTSGVPDRDCSSWILPDSWGEHKNNFKSGDLVEFYREGKFFQHWGLYLGDGLVVHVSSSDLWNPWSSFSERFTNASNGSLLPSVRLLTATEFARNVDSADAMELVENKASVERTYFEDLVIEASPPNLGSKNKNDWFIKVENILLIAGKDKFRVNNVVHRTVDRVVRTPREIFQLVHRIKDGKVNYSLIFSNCEHFVTSLKFKSDDELVPVPTVTISGGGSSQVQQAKSFGLTLLSMATVLVGAAFVGVKTIQMISGAAASRESRESDSDDEWDNNE